MIFDCLCSIQVCVQRFENDREAEMVVTQWFQSQAPGRLLRNRYSEVGPTV
jgi:hypothetical protein